jgi:hypothetical protein
MASGWGCQYSCKMGDITDWCKKLKHKCDPGCKGCIIYGSSFTQGEFLTINSEFEKKVKKRDDNPLEGR